MTVPDTVLPAGPPGVAVPTTLHRPPAVPGARMRVVRLVVLLETVVALVTVLESAVVAAVGMGHPAATVVTAVWAGVLALAARAAGRPDLRRRDRRLLVAVHVVLLVSLGVDLAVAAFQAVAPLPVPLLVRGVLPAAVLLLLRAERRAALPVAPVAPVVPVVAVAPGAGGVR